MTLRLSRLRAQAGLRAVRDQAVVYRLLTPTGDIVGTVHHNGDGIQLRWAIDCPYCGAELGDRSLGVTRHTLRRCKRYPPDPSKPPTILREVVHADIEARLLRAIREFLQYRHHFSGPCGYYHPSGGPSMRQCRGSSRDRRRIDRANRAAAARVADALNHESRRESLHESHHHTTKTHIQPTPTPQNLTKNRTTNPTTDTP